MPHSEVLFLLQYGHFLEVKQQITILLRKNKLMNIKRIARRIKVLIVFGTRPEAIKLSPIIKQFELNKDKFKTIVCVTGQHREMLDQVLQLFEIEPDYNLDIMTDNQSLSEVTSRVLLGITNVLEKEKPDWIFVQGDTTTNFISAVAAFYLKIKIAHVEAGLRTNDKYSPFPEEINRRLTSHIADIHFAPTKEARNNLINEGVDEQSIFVTGNTVIDALKWVRNLHNKKKVNKEWVDYFLSKHSISFSGDIKTILVTGHRRENFGEGFRRICMALSKLAENNLNIQIVYPVHLNPNVQKPVYSALGKLKNIYLIPPLDYEPFIFLISKSYLILTDSGGVQEEAPYFRKPVLVMRDTTERPEGLKAGTAKLVGTNIEKIVGEANKLLYDDIEYNKMARAIHPYGDGNSAKYIFDILSKT